MPGNTQIQRRAATLDHHVDEFAGHDDHAACRPAVHVPRISVDTLGIHVGLDVPTLTSAAMAVGGLMGVVGAAWALWRWSTRSKTQRWSILLQGLGLTLAIVAMVVSILEFLATAFDGVG